VTDTGDVTPGNINRKYKKLYESMERRAVVANAADDVCERLEMFLEEKKRDAQDAAAEALWRQTFEFLCVWRQRVTDFETENT